MSPRRLLPLAALTGLTALKLQHCAGIRRGADLAPLSLLTALSSLNLSGCSQEDGPGISSFATLTGLRCARTLKTLDLRVQQHETRNPKIHKS